MSQMPTNGALASMLVCKVSVCAHLLVCMCEREMRETFAAKSREVLLSGMRTAAVLTTKTEMTQSQSPFPCFAHFQSCTRFLVMFGWFHDKHDALSTMTSAAGREGKRRRKEGTGEGSEMKGNRRAGQRRPPPHQRLKLPIC